MRASAAALTVYSGRNERLVAPLFGRFTERTGIRVRVRYGETSELAATLLEEGGRGPAHLFLSQDAAALAVLSDAGLLRPLPGELLARVPERFASPRGDWIGVSARARMIVYNPRRIGPESLPRRLDDLADRRYRGRFGIAPANASFQAHMAAYRASHGAEATRRLLRGMARNEPHRYPNNSAIVGGVAAGEADWGLTNHYYLWRALKEEPAAPLAAHFLPEGLGFVDVAGLGLIREEPAAVALVAFFLSEPGQRYFATETFEYPLTGEVEAGEELIPLVELGKPSVGFDEVAAVLEETLRMIVESGLLL